MKVEYQNLPNDQGGTVQAEAHIFDNGIHHLNLHNISRQGYVCLGRDELVALVKFLVKEDLSLLLYPVREKMMGSYQ